MTRLHFISAMFASGLILDPDFFAHNQTNMSNESSAGTGISKLDLVCNNLDKQKRFYEKILGLQTRNATGDSFELIAGKTIILFRKDLSYQDPIYHFAFNIPENQITEAIQWLKQKGIALAKQSNGDEVFNFVNWNAHAIYFQDPAGNIVEFIARHTLKNAVDRPFNSASILYASEIGLVVPDVPDIVRKVNNELEFDIYKVKSDNFAAMGNEHNLLILVKTGRPWLGSSENIPSSTFPVTATIRHTKKYKMHFGDLPFVVKFDQ